MTVTNSAFLRIGTHHPAPRGLLLGDELVGVGRIAAPAAPATDRRIQLRGLTDRRGAKRLAGLISAGPLPCAAIVVHDIKPPSPE